MTDQAYDQALKLKGEITNIKTAISKIDSRIGTATHCAFTDGHITCGSTVDSITFKSKDLACEITVAGFDALQRKFVDDIKTLLQKKMAANQAAFESL